MPGPYTGGSRALGFWQSILGAAGSRATTAEIWDSIRGASLNQAAARLGLSPEEAAASPEAQALAQQMRYGTTIGDVSQLRSIAGQVVSARTALMAAPDEFAIDSSMIGIRPNSVTAFTGEGAQIYEARYRYTGILPTGETYSDWATMFMSGAPATKGDLMAQIQSEASAAAASGVGSPPIVELTSIDEVSFEVA